MPRRHILAAGWKRHAAGIARHHCRSRTPSQPSSDPHCHLTPTPSQLVAGDLSFVRASRRVLGVNLLPNASFRQLRILGGVDPWRSRSWELKNEEQNSTKQALRSSNYSI